MLRRAGSTLAAAVLTMTLVACGGDDDAVSTEATEATARTEDTATALSLVPASQPSVPAVELPASIPTEFVVTELRPGEGAAAVAGQIVVVDYVGVRSTDGEQFDSSYGRAPFPVTLGAGGVIAGWDQGLVGSRAGQRLQLDIPADLAYGDQPGDVIQAGDTLTFVINVRAVIPGDAPADGDLPTSTERLTEPTSEDVRPGTGSALGLGDTALFHLVAARGDDGTVLTSSWIDGQAQPLTINEEALPPGLAAGLVGMQVGGRRIITLPYDVSFQVTPETNIVIVADLLAVI